MRVQRIQTQTANRYNQDTQPNFLPAVRTADGVHHPAKALTGEINPAGAMDIVRQGSAGGHARSDDNAVIAAKADLLVSVAYILAIGMITLGLLLIAWMFRWLGGSWPGYAYAGLLGWGIVAVVTLLLNRRQGLNHSPAGVARYEIDARSDIAFHAIDTHADLLRERWRIETGQEGGS